MHVDANWAEHWAQKVESASVLQAASSEFWTSQGIYWAYEEPGFHPARQGNATQPPFTATPAAAAPRYA